MAPRENGPFPGISRSFPSKREGITATSQTWIDGKITDDGAEGLWRVYDNLYDLSSFIDKHPGGPDWLVLTKGTDITEAFEVHHLTDKAETVLKKFFVKKASSPRNSLITFNEDGFYKTLKRKVQKSGLKINAGPTWKTCLLADTLLFLTVTFGVFATWWGLHWAVLAGFCLQALTVCSHNFVHMKDNMRMYYFNFSMMSHRDWRVSHILSHHLFPNTILDLEISMFEPFFEYLPSTSKSEFKKYVMWITTPIVFLFTIPRQFIFRAVQNITGEVKFHLDEYASLGIWILMWIISGKSLGESFVAYFTLAMTASFVFSAVGLTAAHHHPDIYHEGDYLGSNKDFGVLQLAAVRDRVEIVGSFLLVMITFGDHALHHIFPTVDHARLPELYPLLNETCRQFGIEYRFYHVKDLITGMYKQLGRKTWNTKLSIMKKK